MFEASHFILCEIVDGTFSYTKTQKDRTLLQLLSLVCVKKEIAKLNFLSWNLVHTLMFIATILSVMPGYNLD